MKNYRLAVLTLLTASILLATAGNGLTAGGVETTLLKTPPLSEKARAEFPLNLARTNLGAEIQSSRSDKLTTNIFDDLDTNLSAAGLISCDESISYPLPKGATSLIIKLPFLAANNQFSFFGDNGCEGNVTLYGSNTALPFKSDKWKKITDTKSFVRQKNVIIDFPSTEFLVLKIDFEITKAGRVNGLGVFGETKSTGFEEKPEQAKTLQPLSEIVNYDYSGLNNNQASVTHVSSYKSEKDLGKVNNMIDDNTGTSYSFAVDDPSPSLIVDLGLTETIRRITVAYEAAPGSLEFYLLNKLPEDKVTSGANNPQGAKLLKLPSDFYKNNSPIKTVQTETSKLKSSASFDLQSVRYILLRWVPISSQARWKAPQDPRYLFASTNSFLMLPPLLGQIVPATNQSLTVMEINAFGNTTKKRYNPDGSRERSLSNAARADSLVPNDPPRFPPVLPTVSP